MFSKDLFTSPRCRSSARSGQGEWTSREMIKLEGYVQTYGPGSRSRDRANRQHVRLIVHFVHAHLNTISLTNEFSHPGVLVDMQPNFLPVKRMEQNVIAINAQYFALDGLDAVSGFFI